MFKYWDELQFTIEILNIHLAIMQYYTAIRYLLPSIWTSILIESECHSSAEPRRNVGSTRTINI